MQTRAVGKSVAMMMLLLTCLGAMIITSARGAEISITFNNQYIGGETQQVTVDAQALTGATIRTWTLYYENNSLVGPTGTLTDSGSGDYTTPTPISVKRYNSGNYYINVILVNGGDSGEKNWSFTIQHIARFIGIPTVNWNPETDECVIKAVPFYTTQDLDLDGLNNDDLVPEAEIETKEWVMYTLDGGEVAKGTLTFIPALNNWGETVPVAWKNGNFTIGARFKLTNGTTVETGPANRYPFTRNNATEWYIIVFSIIGGAAAALFIFIGIHNKRNASRDLGKKKEKKKEKKEIKVLEISKEDIKKAKAGKAPPPTEEVKEEPKGVTKKSGDLIFEVPKWEEGDADK